MYVYNFEFSSVQRSVQVYGNVIYIISCLSNKYLFGLLQVEWNDKMFEAYKKLYFYRNFYKPVEHRV